MELELKIAEQEAVVRHVRHEYLADCISRHTAGLTLLIGVAVWPLTSLGGLIAIVGLLLFVFTVFNVSQAQKQVETEEKKLFDLKKELIALKYRQ